MTDWLDKIALTDLPILPTLEVNTRRAAKRKRAKPCPAKPRKMSGTTKANFKPLDIANHGVPIPTLRCVGPDQQNLGVWAREAFQPSHFQKAAYHAGHMMGVSPLWPQHYGLI